MSVQLSFANFNKEIAIFGNRLFTWESLRMKSGYIVGRFECERDASPRELKVLKRVKASEKRYQDLVDGIRDGVVWIADLKSLQFLFVSHQVELVFQEGSSNIFLDSLKGDPRIANFREQALGQLQQTGAILSPFVDLTFEHEVKKSENERAWFQSTVRLAEGEDSGQWELRGLSMNITELKRAHEEARRALAIRDRFFSIASHELYTPITTLRMQIEILQRLSKSGVPAEQLIEKTFPSLDRCKSQVDTLTKLIHELLDVSKIKGSSLSLDKESTELSQIVQDVCDQHAQILSRGGIHLAVSLEPKLIGVWDKTRVQQMVTNLFTNAIKYGLRKPIEVRTYSEEGQAVLEVIDHGLGIKAEDQGRIFNLYERAVSDDNISGLGLGLYIVRQLVAAHGGTVELRSDPGTGSTFTLKLPLGVEAVASPLTSHLNSDTGLATGALPA